MNPFQFQNLTITRPLAVFDLETTGTDPQKDRIVEICILKVHPDGSSEIKTRRINPEMPIPPGATAIHGITDADVADQPTFRKVARGLAEFLADTDLAGFNVRRFDLEMLEAEFQRAGVPFSRDGRAVVDALEIYHHHERRDLSAALRLYCGEEHTGAHAAEADVLATARILDAQVARYPDMPSTVQELQARYAPRDRVDSRGCLVFQDGQAVFRIGKHRGRTLREVTQQSPDYLRWMLGSDFSEDLKRVLRRALDEGIFPTPPPAAAAPESDHS